MSDSNTVDFSKLIPELSAWNNGEGISVDSWLGCVGNFQLAIGFSRLFWPDFVEYDDCVLFADFSLESYQGFIGQCAGDRRSVERVMNHRHILDLFHSAQESATREQLAYLGRVLKSIWETKLARYFPTRKVVVSFPEGPYEDLLDYQITFSQQGGQTSS